MKNKRIEKTFRTFSNGWNFEYTVENYDCEHGIILTAGSPEAAPFDRDSVEIYSGDIDDLIKMLRAAKAEFYPKKKSKSKSKGRK